MPIRAIVNEPLLLDHLNGATPGLFGDRDVDRHTTFMPAVDGTVFRPGPRGSPRRLAFYARPRNARNLFEIGLRALRLAAGRGAFDADDWELLSIGQQLPDLTISDRHVLRNVGWMGYEAYGSFLGSVDVLLSLMLSPHTSYPPLEMAVAGGIVVTNTFGVKTAEALAAISPAIRACAPDPGALAALLVEIAREPVERASSGGNDRLAVPGIPATWDDALAETTAWLDGTVAVLRADS
jgi:O-antigen biosynthesis protein